MNNNLLNNKPKADNKVLSINTKVKEMDKVSDKIKQLKNGEK